MNIIEKLESLQQKLVGFELYGFATELQNIIEETKKQKPVGYINGCDNAHELSNGTATILYGEIPPNTPLFTHPHLSDETVKDGYVMVPIEPTEEMFAAGQNKWEELGYVKSAEFHLLYKAMIAEAMKADSAETKA